MPPTHIQQPQQHHRSEIASPPPPTHFYISFSLLLLCLFLFKHTLYSSSLLPHLTTYDLYVTSRFLYILGYRCVLNLLILHGVVQLSSGLLLRLYGASPLYVHSLLQTPSPR
jgi:hypothetical protein